MRISFVVGTRPEIIKISPIVKAIYERQEDHSLFGASIKVDIIATGQHQALAEQAFADVGLSPQLWLQFQPGAMGLSHSVAEIMGQVSDVVQSRRSKMLVVQGDTSSALAGAMAGFYSGIPVAHVEAGLRSRNSADPFPEEMNRRLIAHLAHIHFAPTRQAARNLAQDGIAREIVAITGNTIVDAVQMHPRNGAYPLIQKLRANNRRLITVTCHRRENWGVRLEQICSALKELITLRDDIDIVFPLHGNPILAAQIGALLGGLPRIHLIEPLPFSAFLSLLQVSSLVITDSGGVQEEAVSLGKHVVLCRDNTERPEGIECGLITITGSNHHQIIKQSIAALDALTMTGHQASPFGDGRAAPRILTGMQRFFIGSAPLLPPEQEFHQSAAA